MSGVQFLARVRMLYPHAIRIVLSGSDDPEAMTDAVNDAGVHKYLSKNWSVDRLRAELREASSALRRSLRVKKVTLKSVKTEKRLA